MVMGVTGNQGLYFEFEKTDLCSTCYDQQKIKYMFCIFFVIVIYFKIMIVYNTFVKTRESKNMCKY